MQQVNLYLQEFKSIEPAYSANTIFLLISYVLFFGVLISIGLYVLTLKEQSISTELAKKTEYWKEQFDIAYQQNPEPKISEVLLKTIEGYESQIKRNETVIEYLDGRNEVVSRQVFSIYLEGLTEIKQDNLWLTKIEITKGGEALSLYGRALDPSSLPEYISQISALEIFKSMQFEVFDLKRDGSQMKFVVSSELKEMSVDDYLEKATSKN